MLNFPKSSPVSEYLLLNLLKFYWLSGFGFDNFLYGLFDHIILSYILKLGLSMLQLTSNAKTSLATSPVVQKWASYIRPFR